MCRPHIRGALLNSVYAPIVTDSCDSFLHKHGDLVTESSWLLCKVARINGTPTRWKLTNQSRLLLMKET
jgi:hypothetical protein